MKKNAFAIVSLGFASLFDFVSAASVAIVNPSFETDVISTPGLTLGVPSGWTGTGVGTYRPNPINDGLTPTNGVNTAFSNGGPLSQILVAVLNTNTSYVLQVDVGDRSDLPLANYKVSLFAGSTLIAEDNNTLVPVNGFLTSTVNYTSSASDPLAGELLQIQLFGGGVQVNFDNVRLDASPVPEPSTMVAVLGAIGIASLRRRRNY